MKSLKTRVLVLALMLGTLMSFANPSELDAKKIKIEFTDVKKGHELTIKNNEGNILYTEEVERKGDLVKIFDFSKLENGSYTLELEKDFEIIIKSIKINNDTINFDETSKKKIFKPVVRTQKNRLMVSKVSFDNKPVEVTLLFNDEVIYSEKIAAQKVFKRIYRLDESQKGYYKIIIKNNGRIFVNPFEI